MLVPMSIQERINRFKDDLHALTVPVIVQKHITYGDCHILDQAYYFLLKAEIAEYFKIHPSQVLMVGSGKMGFSIVPNKRYRQFNNDSDIDMAIVCPSLFDNIWEAVFNYKYDGNLWSNYDDFCRYLFQGWIRPDKLPPSNVFKFSKDWWDFFRKLSSSSKYGPYPIKCGIYKSWHYLEYYQSKCVKECQLLDEDE
jgi:hypothetical protein